MASGQLSGLWSRSCYILTAFTFAQELDFQTDTRKWNAAIINVITKTRKCTYLACQNPKYKNDLKSEPKHPNGSQYTPIKM